MTTDDLIIYIKNQLKKNVPKDLIVSRLSQIGWHQDDIDEGFIKANAGSNNISTKDYVSPISPISHVASISPVSSIPPTKITPKENEIKKVSDVEKGPSIFSSYYRPYHIAPTPTPEIESQGKIVEPSLVDKQFKAEEIIANKPIINANEISGAENFVELYQQNPSSNDVGQKDEKIVINNFASIVEKKINDGIENRNSVIEVKNDLPISINPPKETLEISKPENIVEKNIWTPMRVYPLENAKETPESIKEDFEASINSIGDIRPESKRDMLEEVSSSKDEKNVENKEERKVVFEELLPKLIEKKPVSYIEPVVAKASPYIKSVPIQPTAIPIPQAPKTPKKEYQQVSQPIAPKITPIINPVSYTEPVVAKAAIDVKSAPIKPISVPTQKAPEIPKKVYQPITPKIDPIGNPVSYVEPVVAKAAPEVKSTPVESIIIPIPQELKTSKKEYQQSSHPITPLSNPVSSVEPIKTSTREAKNSPMEAIKIPTPQAPKKEYQQASQPITPKISPVSNPVSYVEPITTITNDVKSAPIEPISASTQKVSETPKKDNQSIYPNIQPGTPVSNLRSINDMATKRENQKGFIDLSPARETNAIDPQPINSTFNKINSELNQDKSVDLPKRAMIASYSEDYLSANLIKEKTIQKEKAKIPKSMIIIIIVLILLGALTFGLIGGYIKIPNLNFSFIRKDPKVLLLKSGGVMSDVKSYKVETEANISLSSLSNITASLLNGENMGSSERDDVSISMKGIVNKDGVYQSDFVSIVKSSILKDGITILFKKENDNSFASVSDFSKVFGENIPNLGMIKLSKDKINLLSPKLPLGLGDQARDLEVYQSILGGILEENKQEIANAFGEFIGEVKISKKGEEIIHGSNTYHYIITANKAESKKLFAQLVDIILKDAPVESKIVLDNLIGSIKIDTFDVWIGKDDDNIHQYKVTLEIPLSKVINYENKGISNSQIIFNLQSTYYDFDKVNKISMPTTAIDIDQFLNIVQDTKVKDGASQFKKNARSLYNAEGKFGVSSNNNGLCDQPVAGSLFSPVGHTKGSNTAVGEIAQTMKNILVDTHNTGICYSTPSAWAMALPLIEQQGRYYCLDNTNQTPVIISSLLMGSVCPQN